MFSAIIRLVQLGRKPINSDEESQKLMQNGITNGNTLGQKIARLSSAEKLEAAAKLAQEDGKGKVNSPTTGQQKAVANTKTRVAELLPEYPVFGPIYIDHQSSMAGTKDKSFNHMLMKTNTDDQSMAKAAYKRAVKKVESEAKELYGKEVEKYSSPMFQEMMIKDGCLFLQLAVLMLGCGEKLEYPHGDHPFGEIPNKKDKKQWIESMFFVGNQIPVVVLDALMKEKFFASVIPNISPPASSLCHNVLYDLLANRLGEKSPMKPIDCLHGLHERIMGPEDPDQTSRTIHEWEGSDQIADDNNDFLGLGDKRKKDVSANDDKLRMFPSVTELQELSIYITKLERGLGVRSIKLKSWYFRAYLYLPEFPTNDEDAEMIFRSLTSYETSHLDGKGGEICSYVRFMNDLVQTRKDAKRLEKLKIITVPENDKDYVDKLPKMLEALCDQNTPLTAEFRSLRRQILDYSGPPWTRIKSILNWVAVLTLVQTVVTVLAYIHPRQ